MSQLSHAFKRDLQNLIQKHRIDDLCGKPTYTIAEYLMEKIEEYQRKHIQPENWWNDINSIKSLRKEYGTHITERQESYHEYMKRKLKEHKDD